MIRINGGSVTGPRRSNNEDSYRFATIDEDTVIMVIADGLGGQPAGEVASRIASDSLMDTLVNDTDLVSVDFDELKNRIKFAFNKANIDILRDAMMNPERDGMATTLTVAVIRNRELIIGHYGDCRCYLVRDGHVECLTDDHNLASQLLKEGKITEEEAMTHYGKSKVINCLGDNRYITPDTTRSTILEGDCVILASDGLYSLMDEDMVRDMSELKDNVEALCMKMMERGDSHYSKDNATVVAAYVVPS